MYVYYYYYYYYYNNSTAAWHYLQVTDGFACGGGMHWLQTYYILYSYVSYEHMSGSGESIP